MPDSWELSHGLNPNDSTDGNTIASSGYTMLEEYLNGLVAPANLPLSLLKFDLNINTNKQKDPQQQQLDLRFFTRCVKRI